LHSPLRILAGENIWTLSAFPGFENRTARGVRKSVVPRGPTSARGSFRDLEELFAERGIEVDYVTLYWWVQRFTLLLIDANWPTRHLAGGRWFVEETYVKVSGVWS